MGITLRGEADSSIAFGSCPDNNQLFRKGWGHGYDGWVYHFGTASIDLGTTSIFLGSLSSNDREFVVLRNNSHRRRFCSPESACYQSIKEVPQMKRALLVIVAAAAECSVLAQDTNVSYGMGVVDFTEASSPPSIWDRLQWGFHDWTDVWLNNSALFWTVNTVFFVVATILLSAIAIRILRRRANKSF